MLLIDGFDYWLSWENSLLTYKTINNDQIFQRDGRDALTMFTSHPFLMLFDKANDRIRDSAQMSH